jgi:bacteriocin-like protein
MKKSILNLAGAQELSRKELKNISGGIKYLPCGAVCTMVGNAGCKSGKCQLEETGVAYCIC